MAYGRPAILLAFVIFICSALFGQAGGPVANAGPYQTASVGSQVTLDGSASTSPGGSGTLTYSWAFTSLPDGSTTSLRRANTVMPTFFVDVPGAYVIALTVTNTAGSSTSSVRVSTSQTPPVANAGPNQSVALGATVMLNGNGSTSVDGRPLTYAWVLTGVPSGSTAMLAGANTASPTFVADKPGSYMAQLTVNDGLPSNPSTVTVTTQIVAPVANAGLNQFVNVGSLVQLNGAASTDANGLPLMYQWSLISLPAGSAATPNPPNAVKPTFTVDVPGTYVAQLIVNNGVLSSAPSTVMITSGSPLAPTANAGPNQTVGSGSTVQLNGSGTDPQNLPLTFQWSLIGKPAGSAAMLSSTLIANPTFVADQAGTYVAQLIVKNGFLNSAPATVTISTTCAPPTANPGPDQSVGVGNTVVLNGSASGDVCHDPLTYAWSFTTRPQGSTATLAGADTAAPSFLVDTAGTYVAQLIVNNGSSNSAPATVTITAASGAILFFPSVLTLNSAPGTLVVILPTLAPPGGQIVNLMSSNPSVATVPANVTVPANGVATNVTVTPGSASGTATITATAPGVGSGTGTVNVSLPGISVQVDSQIIGLTSTINGVVTLSAPAPSTTLITLTATPGGIVSVQPGSVSIPAGSMTAAFTVLGLSSGSANIVASSPGYGSGAVTVTVGALGQIILPSGITVGPNQSVPFPVALATGAPSGGVFIALASSDPSKATITPAIVFIPQGATQPSAQPLLNGVNFGAATISASAPGFLGDSKTVQVAAMMGFLSPSANIPVSTTQNLTLSLSSPAPANGVTVTLNSSDPSKATVPTTVLIAPNTNSVAVPVTGVGPGAAIITASAPNLTSATVSVNVFGFGQILVPANVSVLQGQTVAFPVTLPSPAPPGGVTVTLTSADPSKVTVTPTVFIAQNTTAPATPPQVSGIAIGSANITASAPGFTPATQPVKVTASISFTPATLTVNATTTQNLTLNLSAPAPPGGLTINLSSTNPGVATVPPTVAFASGATSVPVPVTGVGSGATTIHASALPAIADTTAGITVVSLGNLNLPSNVTLAPGQSTAFPVSLSVPAPAGGVTVTLTSSDPSKVTISPASVFIAAGATTPPTPPQVTGINGGSANIGASAPGWTSATQVVQVNSRTIGFSPTSLTILGTSTQNLVLNLSSPAPPGGLTINLISANPGVATVPASVMFAANATQVNVPVTGVAGGATTITASAPNIASASANVTVTVDILVPSSLTLAPGASAAYPVSLVHPAPPGGVFVSLTSSDPSKVTVDGAVFIPQGATAPNRAPTVNGISPGTVSITASAPGLASGSGQVQVTSGAMAPMERQATAKRTAAVNLSLAGTVGSDILLPASMTLFPGQATTYPVTLANPAPPGGVFVSLTSSDTSKVTVDATLFIPQGETVSTRATVSALNVGSATITASGSGLRSTIAPVQVTPDGNPSVALSFVPASLPLIAGNTGNLLLNLSTPAPAGGLTVNLSSNNPGAASVPGTVTFGANSTSVGVLVTGVAAGSATIAASAPGIASATAAITVTPAGGGAGSSFFSPASVALNSGVTQNLTLNLSGPAPAGLTASLSSNNALAATVPASVAFPTGATSVSVPVTAVAAGSATITASTPNFGIATASVAVSSPQTGIILPPKLTLAPGQSTAYPVTLANPAPPGGLFIGLTSSNPSKVAVDPAILFFPQGETFSNRASVTGIDIGSAVITVVGGSLAPASGQVQVTAGGVPSASMSFSPTSLSILAGSSGNLTLNLSSPAPAGGLAVSLSSSNPGVAAVAATASFAANATSVAVPVSGAAAGAATITASATGFPNAMASVTVSASLAGIMLPANTSVVLGQTVAFPLALTAPAPLGGIFVTLTSSDPSRVTVTPSSIFISEGGTGSNRASVTGIGAGVSTITATAPGFTAASVQVQAISSAALSLAPGSLTLNVNSMQNLTLTLPAPAPASGQMVNFTSDNPGVASVPAVLTVPANGTSVTVPVTGVAPGAAKITASSLGFAPVSSSITVTTPSPIILPGNVTVAPGSSVNFPVSLAAPAPAGGVFISLTSSNTAIATITPSALFIPQGATASSLTPTVNGVNFGSATVTVSGSGVGSASQQVLVAAGLSIQPSSVIITGTPATKILTLVLSAPAPAGGLTFTLSSSNKNVATVPPSVTILANTTSVDIPVTTVAPGTAMIQASSLPVFPATTATVTVVSTPSIVLLPFDVVGLNKIVLFPITLSTPAPPGGVTVTLASADTSKIIITPSVFIPGGATTPITQPSIAAATNNINSEGYAYVRATAPGYTEANLSILVNDGTTLTIDGNLRVGLGQTAPILFGVSGPAPEGGITVYLTSSDPSIASVPPTAFIPAGFNLPVPFPLATGNSLGSVIITASAPFYIGATQTLQVQ